VSWGTKGDNGAAKDLGGAKKVANKEGEDMYEVDLPTVRRHISSFSNIILTVMTGP
jgi:chitin synthase